MLGNSTDYGLVSVVMPSYNTATRIAFSINSVINQTYHNWELLIIDDCSNDNTDEIVSSFADSRIRYFKNETNYGAAVSRNKALREANGRWIAFLDSDDLWLPTKLEEQLAFMKANQVAFSFTDYAIVHSNGAVAPYAFVGPDVIDERLMKRYCYFSTITVMYDASVVGLIQIADIKKNNDYAMWLKAVKKTKCYRLGRCLSVYCKREGSISSGSKLKLIKHHYYLFRKAQNENVALSIINTTRNLVFGAIKKTRNKEPLPEYAKRFIEERTTE